GRQRTPYPIAPITRMSFARRDELAVIGLAAKMTPAGSEMLRAGLGGSSKSARDGAFQVEEQARLQIVGHFLELRSRDAAPDLAFDLDPRRLMAEAERQLPPWRGALGPARVVPAHVVGDDRERLAAPCVP